MNFYLILIGLAENADLAEGMQANLSERLWTVSELLFSFGPAWQGGQTTVLLKTDMAHEIIAERLSALVGHGDFIGVMQIDLRSMTAIGWNPDEEGLKSLVPSVIDRGGSQL